jgi:hypothetical protein
MLRLLQHIQANVQRLSATKYCLRCVATSTPQVPATVPQVVSIMQCYDNYDQLYRFKLNLACALQRAVLKLAHEHSLLQCRNAKSASRTVYHAVLLDSSTKSDSGC